MIPKLHIIRTTEGADFPLPTYVSKHHVGLILHAAIPSVLKLAPSERALIPIGFGIGIPSGLCGQIVSLPHIAKETGLIVLDAPQILNPADREAIFVLVQNASRRQIVIHRGDEIAQLIVTPVYQIAWNEHKGKILYSTIPIDNLTINESSETNEGEETKTLPSNNNTKKRAQKSVRERSKAADNA